MPDKHPIFNRSVLWPIFLISIALSVPVVLAKSMPPRPQSVTSSSNPSPQSEPSLQESPDKHSAEREWQKRIVSQGLSWPRTPDTTTSAIASQSPVPKTDTPQSQSPIPKTDTLQSQSPNPKTDTPQSQSPVPQTDTPQATSPIAKIDTPQSQSSASKTPTSQPQKSTDQTQASEPSRSNKQQPSKSQGSTNNQNQTPKPSKTAPAIEMRVAIANGVNSLVVGTSTASEVLDARGKVLGRLPANEGINVQPNGANIRIGKWQTPVGVWVKPAKGGFVFVGDRWYRGHLLLVSQGNKLLAVNYIDLESYIASVVGCEVSPSWPMDALKAQAIAARSYALVHYIRPASSLYNLGNTERWQVYRGISSEWNTTRQAAQETHGVFLSYKGGVVESMYAASDDIVTKVFGGRGMSQNGALSLAKQGYNYQQILSNYYPGTSLAWIETKDSQAH